MHCRDRWLAYAAFQFTLGGNILIHGVGRLSDLELENLLQRHPENSLSLLCRTALFMISL